MLHHIQPNRKKSKDGGLTAFEKPLVKGMIKAGYSFQDIVHIVNQGRPTTINLARVTEVKRNAKITPANDEAVKRFLQVQSSYDPKTLLNPYKDERLIRAREAMMAAVQLFNSPTILFKTEMFCVLSNIAWTYLLHEKMERTTTGSSKLENGNSITVGGTLDKPVCPIKSDIVKENLKKVVDIRDAVEHTFFVGGEECFGALFQANCINFERHMTEWFGDHLSLAKELSLALQFVRLNKEQVATVENSNFPEKIKAINTAIQQSPFADSDAFQLNVYYTTEVSSKTNADRRAMLHAYCLHHASLNLHLEGIIGIAGEPPAEVTGRKGSSEELLMVPTSDWTQEQTDYAREGARIFNIGKPENIKFTNLSESEFPNFPFEGGASMNLSSSGGLNRHERRALKARKRRR